MRLLFGVCVCLFSTWVFAAEPFRELHLEEIADVLKVERGKIEAFPSRDDCLSVSRALDSYLVAGKSRVRVVEEKSSRPAFIEVRLSTEAFKKRYQAERATDLYPDECSVVRRRDGTLVFVRLQLIVGPIPTVIDEAN